MRLICEQDVARLIDPREAVDIAADAFVRQALGHEPTPGRLDMRRPAPRAGMLVLSGFSGDGAGIVKSNMHAYRGEPEQRRTASLLALWDMVACEPLALISSTGFNGHRTASGFAAAARVLARPGSSRLAIFGAGHMAAPAIAYISAVRPITHVTVTSRRLAQAQDYVANLAAAQRFPGLAITATADRRAAAAEADVIVCVTSADEPVFPGDAVAPGTLVVLGGANRPAAREADDDLARRARFYCDHAAGCLEKAGDIRLPLAQGAISAEQVVEIGATIAAGETARPDEIPVFKSIGIAPQDLGLAAYVLRKAVAAGAGSSYDRITGAIEGPSS